MKIHLERDKILPILSAMANIADRRPIQPILSHVLLDVREGKVRILATDLEVQLAAQLEISIETPGKTAVPARKLFEICRALPENAQIELKQEGEHIRILSGNARFNLHTLAAEQFPGLQAGIPRLQGNCEAESFRRALSVASVSMAQNDARFFLNGVLVEITGQQMRLVATDGHRLSLMHIPFAHEGAQGGYQGILPRKAVLELLRLITGSSVSLRFSDTSFVLETGEQQFSCKLVDAKYPDYRRVIPVGHPSKAHIQRADFKSALQQIDVVSSDKNPAAILVFQSGEITLRSRNEEQEEAEIRIPAGFQGDTVEIAFNTRYLMDSTQILEDEDIQVSIRDGNSSAMFTGPETDNPLYIVMPIRL